VDKCASVFYIFKLAEQIFSLSFIHGAVPRGRQNKNSSLHERISIHTRLGSSALQMSILEPSFCMHTHPIQATNTHWSLRCQLFSERAYNLGAGRQRERAFLDESAFSAAATGGERRASAEGRKVDGYRLGAANSRGCSRRLKAASTATYAPQVSADLAREHRQGTCTQLGVSRLLHFADCTLDTATRASSAAICISRPICSIASTFPAYIVRSLSPTERGHHNKKSQRQKPCYCSSVFRFSSFEHTKERRLLTLKGRRI
jgi:hypothetical protein